MFFIAIKSVIEEETRTEIRAGTIQYRSCVIEAAIEAEIGTEIRAAIKALIEVEIEAAIEAQAK